VRDYAWSISRWRLRGSARSWDRGFSRVASAPPRPSVRGPEIFKGATGGLVALNRTLGLLLSMSVATWASVVSAQIVSPAQVIQNCSPPMTISQPGAREPRVWDDGTNAFVIFVDGSRLRFYDFGVDRTVGTADDSAGALTTPVGVFSADISPKTDGRYVVFFRNPSPASGIWQVMAMDLGPDQKPGTADDSPPSTIYPGGPFGFSPGIIEVRDGLLSFSYPSVTLGARNSLYGMCDLRRPAALPGSCFGSYSTNVLPVSLRGSSLLKNIRNNWLGLELNLGYLGVSTNTLAGLNNPGTALFEPNFQIIAPWYSFGREVIGVAFGHFPVVRRIGSTAGGPVATIDHPIDPNVSILSIHVPQQLPGAYLEAVAEHGASSGTASLWRVSGVSRDEYFVHPLASRTLFRIDAPQLSPGTGVTVLQEEISIDADLAAWTHRELDLTLSVVDFGVLVTHCR
jgi:hypothetical protein